MLSTKSQHQKSIYEYEERPLAFQWCTQTTAVLVVIHALGAEGIRLMACDTDNLAMVLLYVVGYGYVAGLGVTAGAHRLWTHRSYKARLPLRIFLAVAFTAAGQWDLLWWCCDHRVHHKYTDTDADPHNTKRGFFYAHIGWLVAKRHPACVRRCEETTKTGMSDLLADPVVRFQKNFYYPLFYGLVFVLPTWVGVTLLHKSLWYSFCVCAVLRYLGSLHSTWLVNSAAHMFGDKPYDSASSAGDSAMVSFAAIGEAWHNYHHAYPWDYRTSEMGWRWNFTGMFIDAMAAIGLAYDLKTVKPESIAQRRSKVAAVRNHDKYATQDNVSVTWKSTISKLIRQLARDYFTLQS